MHLNIYYLYIEYIKRSVFVFDGIRVMWLTISFAEFVNFERFIEEFDSDE